MIQCLALAIALVPLPIERRKRLPLAGFEYRSRPRNPVFVLSVDQMRHYCAHTPRILALVTLRPHLRRAMQQGLESGRRALKQRDRIFEILFQWSSRSEEHT